MDEKFHDEFLNLAFTKSRINSMELNNRFVRAATWMASVDENGFVNDETLSIYEKLAEGGIGLIITEPATVSKNLNSIRNINISEDTFIDGLTRLVEKVHKFNSKIAVQFFYGQTNSIEDTLPHEVSLDQIDQIVEKFGSAAQRAVKAGFDAIEIHAAHGYFLSRFLSPFFNKRSDKHGGSLENRMRILEEVIDEMRKNVSKNYPLIVKIDSEDSLENNTKNEEIVEIIKILKEKNVDAVEISGINPIRPDIVNVNKEAYFLKYAMKIKKEVNMPLILTGGIRSLEVIVNILKNGYADYIGLSRPLIAEPNLINRWKNRNLSKAKCLSCNECCNELFSSEFVGMVVCKKW